MSKLLRIGVFGGTFDPIHKTHLEIARAARDQARLDRVLFVPAASPPHKQDDVLTDAEDRFAMVAAAITGEPGFEASRIEIDREGPSYTIDTLDALGGLFPDAEFFLIIGFDSLVDLPRWRRAEAIVARAGLLVAPRLDSANGLQAPYPDRVQMLRLPASPVSSTEIRERLAAGQSAAEWLPAPVLRVIEARGLYHAHR